MSETRRLHQRQPRGLIEATIGIDLRWLKRHGQIPPGETCVTLCTTAGQHHHIRLVHLKRPRFGGVRTYFLCPVCDRRCEVLYWNPSLGCRICHRLAFAIENQSKIDRAFNQLQKRRHNLGQTGGGIVAPLPGKPKWWRWPRYLRLRHHSVQLERAYWKAIAAFLCGRLTKQADLLHNS